MPLIACFVQLSSRHHQRAAYTGYPEETKASHRLQWEKQCGDLEQSALGRLTDPCTTKHTWIRKLIKPSQNSPKESNLLLHTVAFNRLQTNCDTPEHPKPHSDIKWFVRCYSRSAITWVNQRSNYTLPAILESGCSYVQASTKLFCTNPSWPSSQSQANVCHFRNLDLDGKLPRVAYKHPAWKPVHVKIVRNEWKQPNIILG